MMDCYNHGYTKALLDVQEWFRNHSLTMRYNRLYNEKGVNAILAALVENREELRETGSVNLIVNKKTREISKWLSKEERMKEK